MQKKNPVIKNYIYLSEKRILNNSLENIKTLSKRMSEVQKELITAQQNDKLQQAYNFDEDSKGNIINIEE